MTRRRKADPGASDGHLDFPARPATRYGLAPIVDPTDPGPEIDLDDGQMPSIIEQWDRLLLMDAGGSPVYRRGTQLVQLVRTGPTSAREYGKTSGRLVVRPISPAGLQEVIGRLVRLYRVSRDGERRRRVAPPLMYITAFLGKAEHALPTLTGIGYGPTIAPDGTLIEAPGYNTLTGLFLDFDRARIPSINPAPSMDDGRAALSTLVDLLCDFPFEEPADMSVTIAAIITACVRRSLPTAPVFGFSAPVMGSGKTLAAQVVSMIATGTPAPVTPPPTSDNPAEFEKIVSALLLDGREIALIDNLETVLESPYLASLQTSESTVIRVLGSSQTVVIGTGLLWLVTANNLQVAGDMTTRTLISRLNALSERPEERSFEVNLYEYVPEHRGELIAAALTIVLAFLHSGVDPATLCKPWGRFEVWSDWVRAPLIWLGWPDPCDVLKRFDTTDPRRTELAAVLSSWHACRGVDRIKVRDLVDSARGDGEVCANLREALQAVAGNQDGTINARRLGRWIARHSGRISCGLSIEQAGTAAGQIIWRLVEQST